MTKNKGTLIQASLVHDVEKKTLGMILQSSLISTKKYGNTHFVLIKTGLRPDGLPLEIHKITSWLFKVSNICSLGPCYVFQNPIGEYFILSFKEIQFNILRKILFLKYEKENIVNRDFMKDTLSRKHSEIFIPYDKSSDSFVIGNLVWKTKGNRYENEMVKETVFSIIRSRETFEKVGTSI